jgi:hypothetical protein
MNEAQYKRINRIIYLMEELQRVRAEEEIPIPKESFAALHALRQRAGEYEREKGGRP